MKQIILALAAFFSFQILFAQDVTYVLFDRNCMSQLEYRYSYPNLKGENAVWAYSVKPNVQEHFIFMTEGAGHYSPELPKGTVACGDLNLDDAFVASINRDAQQVLIVFQRQSGGYWLLSVESATLVARKGTKYWVRARQSSFQFDTLRMVNEQNLAVVSSPTAAYFSGVKLNNCLMEYSFHCEPVKAGQIRSDFQFIPNIGIINDRTGNSASQAMENELQLVKVNGKTLNEFIIEACPEGAGKIAMSKFQKPTEYGDGKFDADKEISSIMQKEQDTEAPATYSKDINGIRCAEDWEPGTHIVQKGENLRAIARTYKVTEPQLIQWNKIQNPDRIEICQKIWLKQPPANASIRGTEKAAKTTVSEVPPVNGKTVKVQRAQGQKGTQADPGFAQKSLAPNRPVEHAYGTDDNGDYEYFDPKKTNANPGPKIHTVLRGEYLYKIAKMYGCPEECIRIANAMPLEGDEPLVIGQEIIIPECTCSVDGKVIKRPALPSPKPTVNKQIPGATSKVTKTRPKMRPNLLEDTDTDPTPAQYNYEENKVSKDSDWYEESSIYEEDGERESKSSKVLLYKEHYVRQGETLRSIAAKYKADAAELSKINGLDPKEDPVPGKTFLIPVVEREKQDKARATGKPATEKKSSSKQPFIPKAQPRPNLLEEDPSETNLDKRPVVARQFVDEDRDAKAVTDTAKPKTRKPSSNIPASDATSIQHLVKKGDTIKSIAEKYNVSPFELSQINNIGQDDALIPGRKIWIPVD
ncbi:MAG: LysM peptidoglycan-binding domain-containing protein [Saprospiraceae bacterium]|nr:LysM peptidoglycan-binding domain-containing protein [Saprospiraceae bacterium]